MAFAALVAAGVLTGCGFTGSAYDEADATSSNAAIGSLSSDPALNGEVLYKLLVGELASHRGDLILALENYLEVAGITGDAAVAARATKLAVFAHAEERALEAARMWIDAAPSSVEGRRVLASLLIRAGDADGAVEHLERIVKAGFEPPGAGFHHAAEILGAEKNKGSRGRGDEAARARARGRCRGPARPRPAPGSHRIRR